MKYIKFFIACFLVSITFLAGHDTYTKYIRQTVLEEVNNKAAEEATRKAAEKDAARKGVPTLEIEVPCDDALAFLKMMIESFPAGPMFMGQNDKTGFLYHLYLNKDSGVFAVTMTSKEERKTCLVGVGDSFQLKEIERKINI